ncbi:PREDICTED: sex-regulated protein janus-B isoform X1 [Drosophila arizonae]|uniref:Sex-regulated protein janus-B isoform X1 n=1 Tax=Drosophila arizonae TaxID=7263 RepID=A0ABM1NZG9_DROAR|nr:PREDICTED: sex-regulated protein janus-B isoform X1 [Drosophila arizonae]
MDKVRKLVLTTWRPVLRKVTRMCCDAKVKNLVAFPEVNIGEGKLKYILAKVYVHGEMGQSKTVIRGVSRVKYHLDVYDQLQKEANKLDLCTQCLGGGIMVHDNDKHYIKIYGRSQTLGRADHHEAREVLHEHDKYSSYKIDAESGGQDA